MAKWDERIAMTSFRFMRVSRESGLETEVIRALRGGRITRNLDTDIKESAECPIAEKLDIGPDLVRIYMTCEWAGGETEDVVLGTFLPVIPARSIRSGYSTATVRMYGRLQELVDDAFAAPVTVERGENAVSRAKKVCEDCGLTVVSEPSNYTLSSTRCYGIGSEGATDTDTKLSMVNDLLSLAGFRSAFTDPMGRVVFEKYREPSEIAPAWEFVEGATAKFEADMTEERDYTDVANHVVVYYGPDQEGRAVAAEAWDRDPGSPLSTVSRGRTITRVKSYSELPDGSSDQERQKVADAKAKSLLDTEQSVVWRVTMRHAYVPVKLADTVIVDYASGDVQGKFQERTQVLTLVGGCPVDAGLRVYDRGRR